MKNITVSILCLFLATQAAGQKKRPSQVPEIQKKEARRTLMKDYSTQWRAQNKAFRQEEYMEAATILQNKRLTPQKQKEALNDIEGKYADKRAKLRIRHSAELRSKLMTLSR